MLNGWLMILAVGGLACTLVSLLWTLAHIRHKEVFVAPLLSTLLFATVAYSVIPLQQAVIQDTAIAVCYDHGRMYRQLIEPRQSILSMLTARPQGSRKVVCRDGTTHVFPVNVEPRNTWPSL